MTPTEAAALESVVQDRPWLYSRVTRDDLRTYIETGVSVLDWDEPAGGAR